MNFFDLLSVLALLAFWFGVFFFARSLRRLEDTVDRMEAATKVVKDNLADAVARADATEGDAGASADAALRTGDTAEAIHERQDD